MLATATAKLGFAQLDSGSGAIGAWSANDVVQQVLLELMKRGRGLADSINGPLGAYLRGAVAKRALTAFEKDRDLELDDPDLIEELDDGDFTERIERDRDIASAVGLLNEQQHHVVLETLVHGRSNADVGRELDTTGQYVGQVQKRALAKLAAELGGDER